MSRRKLPPYVVEPGYVTSQTDGDRHYIGPRELVRLYGLKRGEYVVAGQRWPLEWPRLRPRYDGQYGRPAALDRDRSPEPA